MSNVLKPMKPRQREAVLAQLADSLWSHDSWCGETHLQKASFVLEALCAVPLELNHILYKYGPYSSVLSDELVVMKSDVLLEAVSVRGYGPRLRPTDAAKTQLLARWPRTLKRYASAIDFVARKMGNKGVAELERLATAIWVRRELPDETPRDQALRLIAIKPHVSLDAALAAINVAGQWEKDALQLRVQSRAGKSPTRKRSAPNTSART
jgi:hypothetical protein